jgi:hypothetical protein
MGAYNLATARNTLLQQVLSLFANPADEGSAKAIDDLLIRYRVQTKPGVVIPEGMTARDALGEKIHQLWKSSSPVRDEELGQMIDTFRMQLKQKASKKKSSGSKSRAAAKKASPISSMPKDLMKQSASASKSESQESTSQPHAVAGGPPRRKRRRSECPKCHSMGVVLAQSYSGDDYYSCVYCGWQAYIPADENDPTASIASRLLGQASNEK